MRGESFSGILRASKRVGTRGPRVSLPTRLDARRARYSGRANREPGRAPPLARGDAYGTRSAALAGADAYPDREHSAALANAYGSGQRSGEPGRAPPNRDSEPGRAPPNRDSEPGRAPPRSNGTGQRTEPGLVRRARTRLRDGTARLQRKRGPGTGTRSHGRAVVLIRTPSGPRLWILGQRVHHGATGIALALALGALRRRNGALVALALVAHDRRDWRVWFSRERPPQNGAETHAREV